MLLLMINAAVFRAVEMSHFLDMCFLPGVVRKMNSESTVILFYPDTFLTSIIQPR